MKEFEEGDGDLWFDHFSEDGDDVIAFRMSALFYLQDIRNLLKILLKKEADEKK